MSPEQIDARRFERLVGERRFAEALALWRGPALADLAAEPFAQAQVAFLEGRRLTTVEDAKDAELAAGRGPELVGELEGLVAQHPLRERLHGQLMRALYRAGRQAEALDVYRRAREVLADELGIDPSPELQALERAVLAQDPALVVPAQAATNLPVRYASFVGRRSELAEVAKLAEGNRLVTLTGPGGVGKTALALEVARGRRERHSEGAWFVELASVTDPALLAQAVGAALRIREQPGPQDPRPPSQRLAASSRRGTCWSSWTTPSTSPRHVPRWPNSS